MGNFAAVALGLLTTTLQATASCTTHQCDASCKVFGGGPTPNCDLEVDGGAPLPHIEGDQLVWESSAQDVPWLDFPGQRTIVITYPQPFACPPEISAQVAADVNHPQNNFVEVGGNLAQYSNATATGISILNPSCAEYGLRVVARGFPASSPSTWWCRDAGADASSADAAVESANESSDGSPQDSPIE